MHPNIAKTLIVVLLGAILLGGCAEPVSMTLATTIASYGFDGLSYASEGKSVGDIAISQVADEDCALFRILKDEPICHDFTLVQRRDMAVARVEADRLDRRATGVSDPDLYAPPKMPDPRLVAQAQEAQASLDEAQAKAAIQGELASLEVDADNLRLAADRQIPPPQAQAKVSARTPDQKAVAAKSTLGANHRAESLLADRRSAGDRHGTDEAVALQPSAHISSEWEEQAWLPI